MFTYPKTLQKITYTKKKFTRKGQSSVGGKTPQNITWNLVVGFFKTKTLSEIPNHRMFPFKLVALSGNKKQVSYANTRLPTEYGDKGDPGGPIVSVSNNYKENGVGRSLCGEIATIIMSLVWTSSFQHNCYQ